jgi:cytochrome c oxidase subunit 2
MAKLQGLLFGLATVALVALATFFFTKSWLPPLNSDRVAIDNAIGVSLVLTGVLFIGTNLLLAWFSWRFQDGEGVRATYWHHNSRLEWTWTLVTAAVVTVLLFNALGLWAQITSAPPADAFMVEVTGQQFAWNIRYPGKDGIFGRTDPKLVSPEASNFIGLDRSDPNAADDIMMQNQLFLPAGRPVRILIRSLDVIHSFFLPNFRVKQDAMPGMTVETWFVPTQTGDFDIACAQHCGLGHYRMRGQVHIVPPEELEARIKQSLAE